MFTIKQVAGLTGVSEAVLRAWESRYGVVTPERSAGRYRLYSDAQIAVLREMAALVEAGMPPSRAAAVLMSASHPVGAAGARTTSPGAAEGGAHGEGAALIRAAANLDPAQLDAAIAAGEPRQFEAFADHWLPGRLRELGDAWAAGEVGVAGEHFASAGLMRAIAASFDDAGPAVIPGRVLVGLPPGSRHEVMLFAFASCLKRAGVDVVYLGADVPAVDWERAAGEHRARAAVIAVTSYRPRSGSAQAVVDRLAALVPPVGIWIGGSRRSDVTGGRPLPDAPSEAAALVARSLRAGGA
ncbi:hypothetical protein BW730_02795 [Tessaracoccus aquimaris]|uniref:HTH merR-type domain-containing protein n=1 Tax=Tessaracoccus aquimaris TaxID=1332264 RepID=A0A1Q2CKH7_9ACTN|nr:MerR family transcriptional regulator [Tessaracoccus aquimaris]AQP46619.1 hypothetical protein BW730_02795 [Tessaracoccus aquimaris]